ncbi:MAG: N-acetylmuramoyl-L-alanine amidase [Bacillota bacterium]|nr:N-acetylmuramoyl-L-alanine amidase [Bacillota bacterium]
MQIPRTAALRSLLIGALILTLLGSARWLLLQQPSRPALSAALLGHTIVVDAGHGDWDPGMIGTSGALEKDIDLAIAKKLAEYLRAGGATVLLTREDDAVLGADKAADMAARRQLAEQAQADMFISVHANSFVADRSQHGAQCFYQRGNERGQQLAELLQAALIAELGDNQRSALVHNGSYLLKNLDMAAVIVETGFLSNAEEEALLMDNDYQWQVALAIYSGVIDYYNAQSLR